MSYHGASRKRKETEKSSGEVTAINKSNATTSLPGAESSLYNNRLLAGYMAYEFLTKGTLLGKKFDPARAEAMPAKLAAKSRTRAEGSRRNQLEAEPKNEKVKKLPSQSYAEVARLLKGNDGTHIPGIVNPTELARWIQL